MSRVFKRMNKKAEYNLHRLVYLFARAISLRMIDRTVKELDLKLVKERCLKLTKEFWVTVSDQLTRQPPVDKVKFGEKDVGPFLDGLYVFSFNKSNSLKELIRYQHQGIVTAFTQRQHKNEVKRQCEEEYERKLNRLQEFIRCVPLYLQGQALRAMSDEKVQELCQAANIPGPRDNLMVAGEAQMPFAVCDG